MEMQEKKLKKFKVYKVIAKVLFIIVLIAGIIGISAAVIGEVILIAKGPEVIAELNDFIGDMGIGIDLPFDEVPHLLMTSLLLYGLTGLSLALFILRSVYKLFGNIVETKTPFHPDSIKRVKAIGIAFFIYAGLQLIINAVSAFAMVNIIGNTAVMDFISLNWSAIIFGVLLLALAEIFEFGASLQQDNASIV